MVSMSMSCARMSRITCQDLVVGLAQADHQAALGRHAGRGLLEALEQVQAEGVVGARPRLLVQARRRSPGCGSSRRAARPSGCRARGPGGRGSRAPGSRCASPATARASAGCSRRSAPAPPSRRSSRSTLVMTTYLSFSAAIVFARFSRLVGVQRVGPAVADVAERAAPRALVAHDHEGGRALAEALADVRAGGFLAHRVQLVLAQDLLDLVEARARRAGLDADPVGLLQRLGRHHLDRDARGLGLRLLLGGGVVGRRRGIMASGGGATLSVRHAGLARTLRGASGRELRGQPLAQLPRHGGPVGATPECSAGPPSAARRSRRG